LVILFQLARPNPSLTGQFLFVDTLSEKFK